MKKTTDSIKRRLRLRKTKAKRKVVKSRSQYASKKVKSMTKGLKRKTTRVKKSIRKAASPMRMKKAKKVSVPNPNEIKIVEIEEVKPSCGCGM